MTKWLCTRYGEDEKKRLVTVSDKGMPFYKSSGKNGFKGLWMPIMHVHYRTPVTFDLPDKAQSKHYKAQSKQYDEINFDRLIANVQNCDDADSLWLVKYSAEVILPKKQNAFDCDREVEQELEKFINYNWSDEQQKDLDLKGLKPFQKIPHLLDYESQSGQIYKGLFCRTQTFLSSAFLQDNSIQSLLHLLDGVVTRLKKQKTNQHESAEDQPSSSPRIPDDDQVAEKLLENRDINIFDLMHTRFPTQESLETSLMLNYKAVQEWCNVKLEIVKQHIEELERLPHQKTISNEQKYTNKKYVEHMVFKALYQQLLYERRQLNKYIEDLDRKGLLNCIELEEDTQASHEFDQLCEEGKTGKFVLKINQWLAQQGSRFGPLIKHKQFPKHIVDSLELFKSGDFTSNLDNRLAKFSFISHLDELKNDTFSTKFEIYDVGDLMTNLDTLKPRQVDDLLSALFNNQDNKKHYPRKMIDFLYQVNHSERIDELPNLKKGLQLYLSRDAQVAMDVIRRAYSKNCVTKIFALKASLNKKRCHQSSYISSYIENIFNDDESHKVMFQATMRELIEAYQDKLQGYWQKFSYKPKLMKQVNQFFNPNMQVKLAAAKQIQIAIEDDQLENVNINQYRKLGDSNLTQIAEIAELTTQQSTQTMKP